MGILRGMAHDPLRPYWRCDVCGFKAGAAIEDCPECHGMDFTKVVPTKKPKAAAAPKVVDPTKCITTIEGKDPPRIPLPMKEIARVLGGIGFVIGSIVLLTGEPGAGKSTLLLQLIAQVARYYKHREGVCLYATGEESDQAVGSRARRTGDSVKGLRILATNSIAKVEEAIRLWKPKFLILDSVQTFSEEEDGSGAGTIRQIKTVLARLRSICSEFGITMLMICHITKDGLPGGPKALEHMVDVFAQLTGDRLSPIRLLTAVKNRFGTAGETAVLEHTGTGLIEVPDPGAQMLRQRAIGEPGSVMFPSAELARPAMVEIEAMVNGGPGKNEAGDVVSGGKPVVASVTNLSGERLPRLVNLLAEFLELRGTSMDIEANIPTRGSLGEPPLDLALAMAIVSSALTLAVPADTVVMGTVSVTGRVKSVPRCLARLEVCKGHGFTRALVPLENAEQKEFPKGVEVVGIQHVRDLAAWLTAYGTKPSNPRRPSLGLAPAPEVVAPSAPRDGSQSDVEPLIP